MAFIHARFFSRVLEKQVGLYALIPDAGRGPFPVFYLLHGLSDDYTIWHRRTRIEWYVRDLPLIVAMPDGFRGFYTDNAEGPAYGRYMLEDAVGFAERVLPAIGNRSGRCIGGLSMGGYGALRLALSRPDMFVSATSHSGAIFPWDRDFPERLQIEMRRIFGAKPRGSEHDILALARKLKRRGKNPFPKLRLDCGTGDGLIAQNRALHAEFDRIGIPHEYEEFPGGHEWDYWDARIREAIAFHCKALGISAAPRR